MKLVKANTYTEMSEIAANLILEHVISTDKITLGLATGGTPTTTYQKIIDDHKRNQTSFKHVTTVNLDEYIGIATNDPNSYRHYMDDHLFNDIDIPKEQTFLPNGLAQHIQEECESYEEKIKAVGGIDLQLLGLGSNGHIGFNEPGTPFNTRTHVVKLEESTREANARFFNSLEEVPTHAITMGIATIMESKEIILLVSGEKKSKALARLLNGEIDPSFPASKLRDHPNVTIIADKEALKDSNIDSEKSSMV